MKLFRVTNERYANHFNGKGVSYDFGARWNVAGQPVIYFATDMATALVEAANYLPAPDLVPATHCKATYIVDGEVPIEYLDSNVLPDDWDAMPYPASTQLIGEQFLLKCDALFLMVPSVGVGSRDEYNVAVANPLHPLISSISLVNTIKPVYSPRMFGGLTTP